MTIDAARVGILAIGGIDPSGGAGLVRDYLTSENHGVPAFLIGTAWTLQGVGGVSNVEPRNAAALIADIRAALGLVRPAAVKIGMVATGLLADAIVDGLNGYAGPVVFDPVLGASRGGALFAGAGADLARLLARATLVTPNRAEAALLAGLDLHQQPGADDHGDDAWAATTGRALLMSGSQAVLIKGGHGPSKSEARDWLFARNGTEVSARLFVAPRLPGASPRGTGCALATAIAIRLGCGEDLPRAIADGKAWLHTAIANARTIGDERRL